MTADKIATIFRGTIGLILALSVPVLYAVGVDVPEPLWTLTGIVVGYYYRGLRPGA